MKHPIFIATNRKKLVYDDPETKVLADHLFHDDKFNDGRLGADELTFLKMNDDKSYFLKGSEECFKEAQDYMIKHTKNAVFFVHGFNNGWLDAINSARAVSDTHDVVVIMFSWPSDVTGLPFEDYREKKKNAMKSVGALDRTLMKLYKQLKTSRTDCEQSISGLFHSMANLLFKNSLISDGHYYSRKKIFDNVILSQADTNAKGSNEWIDLLNVRGEVYVTINEKDRPLRFSHFKFGKAQKKRLG